RPSLSEDDIDDLLYFARTNDTSELSTLLTSLSSQHACSQSDILLAARDPESGNTVAHYAAANGFDAHANGTSPSLPSNAPTKASTNNDASAKSQPPELFTVSNASGSTPLHYAATTGSLACAQMLVQAGVEIGVRNAMGRMAVYEAEAGGKEEIVAYLLKEGGDAVVEGQRAEEKEEEGDD
ncbi:ankyrin, partial [Viridothelium virens]